MQINKIQQSSGVYLPLQKLENSKSKNNFVEQVNLKKPDIPLDYWKTMQINFRGETVHSRKTVMDIEHENYMTMSEATKKRLRKLYDDFFTNNRIDKTELFDQKHYQYMPLRSEDTLDKFLEFSKMYNNYKDQPIICVGRSPKWFLNASMWMDNGIKDYKFAAFSSFWYRKHPVEVLKPIEKELPTPKEEAAYKRYLKRIQADPATIVENMKKTGKRTVLTDYIHTGRGLSSFLSMLSKFADEQGILEDFSKSIELVCIGSMEYEGILDPYAYTLDTPEVLYSKRLMPYQKNIKQHFYSMPAVVLEEMLINQNTNECRSTYYPHTAWTIYKPDQFKTGLIHDMNKVKQKMKELKDLGQKTLTSFTPAMADYRNLLNFRILDGLAQRGLLKATHISKI